MKALPIAEIERENGDVDAEFATASHDVSGQPIDESCGSQRALGIIASDRPCLQAEERERLVRMANDEVCEPEADRIFCRNA